MRLKGRQMEAESPITRNLCTDVKQLEWSQGPDTAVPASHGSYILSKFGTIRLFCQGEVEPCISVIYQLIGEYWLPVHSEAVVPATASLVCNRKGIIQSVQSQYLQRDFKPRRWQAQFSNGRAVIHFESGFLFSFIRRGDFTTHPNTL